MQSGQQLPLRYKFWAVNAVAFFSVLVLVVVAMLLEQRSVNQTRQQEALSLLQLWQGKPALHLDGPLQPVILQPDAQAPAERELLAAAGPESRWVELAGLTLWGAEQPVGAWVLGSAGSGALAVVVSGKSFQQIFIERAPIYAFAVFVLMLGVLFGSQLLIRFVDGYQSRLRTLAHYDPLTGLPNRVLARDRLEHAKERIDRRGGWLAVLFIDLDRFKTLNDSYGHDFGDLVLQSVAHRLQERCRLEDTLARLGGDEFLLILEQLHSPGVASQVAKSLLDSLKAPLILDEAREVYIGASIGIALYPRDGGNAHELIRNADAAMYRAKAQGRNTFSHYLPSLTEEARARFELERSLRGALSNGELYLHYQPLVDLPSGRCIGAEALLRWHSADHGQVGPDRFIPLAEESGQIVALGTWVLHQACRQASLWRTSGIALDTIAVNLSPIQFMQQNIVQVVRAALEASGLPGQCLELELTEGALMQHTAQAEQTLGELRALGVRISVDDFGTGYSSLAYLRRFALDKLKIDKSFLAGLPGDPSDCQLVQTIIALARNMRLSVLAEGVETVEQQAWLEAQGCDQCQGYLIGRPLTVDAFAARWQALQPA